MCEITVTFGATIKYHHAPTRSSNHINVQTLHSRSGDWTAHIARNQRGTNLEGRRDRGRSHWRRDGVAEAKDSGGGEGRTWETTRRAEMGTRKEGQ